MSGFCGLNNASDRLRERQIVLKLGKEGFFQCLDGDMLGSRAASVRIVVTFHKMRICPNERRAAGRAADNTAQPVLALRGRLAVALIGFFQFGTASLRRVPRFDVDDWFVQRVGDDAVLVLEISACPAGRRPAELAEVDGVIQDIINGTVFKGIPTVRADATGTKIFRDAKHGITGDEAPEDLPDDLGFFRDDDQLPVFYAIAEGWCSLQGAILCIDGHGAFDFLRKADGVEFVHPLNDPLDQAAEGASDQRLGDGHHIDLALAAQDGFIENGFLLIAGKAGELPDDDDVEGVGRVFGSGDHLLEAGALFSSPAGNAVVVEDVFREQEQAVLRGVFADFLHLGIRGQLHLVIG